MLDRNSIVQENYYLNKRKDARAKTRFLRQKHLIFLLAIFSSLLLSIALYFLSSASRIYAIKVEGNYLYTREEIIELSGIRKDDRFLLLPFRSLAKRLEKDPLIAKAKISLLSGNNVLIRVEEEKPLAYALENREAVLILKEGKRFSLTAENMKLIAYVPLITGYEGEKLETVIQSLGRLDRSLINEMSEIHCYPMSYDENMMEIIMRDGNYAFVSPIGIEILSRYFDVVSSAELSETKACFFFDEVTNKAFQSRCPWTPEPPVELEEESEEK